MPTRSRLSFRQLLAGLSALAAFLFLTVFLFTYRRDERLFETISAKLFREEMLASTLDMHYTLAHPENFGIYRYDAVLPRYSSDSLPARQAETENLLAALGSLNEERLNAEDAYARQLLLRSLEISLSMGENPYLDEPLSPSGGAQSQLPILLAEYTFRTEQDVLDYLKLLDQTDEYFASLLCFEQEKAAAGLLMAKPSLEKVIEQCDTILDKASLEKEDHFLQRTFRERLLVLVNNGVISQEAAKAYAAQNNRLLRTVMQPAYEDLADSLCLLVDEEIPLAGLASHDGGAAYYELLLRLRTGSDRGVPEIKELLLQKINEESAAVKALLSQHPQLAQLDYGRALEVSFPYHSAAQMLADLQFRMQGDFPAFHDSIYLAAQPCVTVKPVSESLQEYSAPAFFLTPPLDDTTANVIYINEKNAPSKLELYTTLAHEGYPGHLYQSVFYNRCQEISPALLARQLLWYGGYLEGWALYVEFLSFDFASDLLEEQGEALLAQAVQLEKHNRSLLLCLYSLIDLFIHYDNASEAQIENLLSSFGLGGKAAANAVYEYIVEEPANYPKYYLGYLEILSLREQARAQWQDQYTDYGFHTFYLESGPSDFQSLSQRLSGITKPESLAQATGEDGTE